MAAPAGAPSQGCGTVFKFDVNTGTLTTLHQFTGLLAHGGVLQTGDNLGGGNPVGGVILKGGILYGTTIYGGNPACATPFRGCGTVFKYDLNRRKFTTLYRFKGGPDGSNPEAGVIFQNGILYGTTVYGGIVPCALAAGGSDGGGCGTVFGINANTGAKIVTLPFTGAAPPNGNGGHGPKAPLTGLNGTFYGTTGQGGSNNACTGIGGAAGGGGVPGPSSPNYDYCGTVFRFDAR